MILAWSEAIAAVLATAGGHLLFKIGVQRGRRVVIAAGVAGLGLALVLTYLALQKLNVGSVYMLTAMTPVLTSIGASLFAHERVPNLRWFAIALCSLGLVLYQLG